MNEASQSSQALVLIVDDQSNWRETLKDVLEVDGHRVCAASSLKEARALIQAEDFDVAILDIRLLDERRYDVQGLQLLKEIRTAGFRTRVLMMTGYAPPGVEELAQQLGAEVFTLKTPREGFNIAQFRKTIRGLVERARMTS